MGMGTLKTSISLDERLVAQLDQQAEADEISSSELIERICRGSLDQDPKVEFFRMNCMPTEVLAALSAVHWHDEDGPVELVMRVPASDWEEWRRRRKAKATKKKGGS
ncbi:MAG: hypothetical protein DHS20C14_01550 [Phycisphaeraceae bacterium]|nr:MAG: hypothetical protein DHS20C14_01550 [Phycisphaeraceae bacterium]